MTSDLRSSEHSLAAAQATTWRNIRKPFSACPERSRRAYSALTSAKGGEDGALPVLLALRSLSGVGSGVEGR